MVIFFLFFNCSQLHANLSFVSPPTTLLVESCLRFAELIPQGQGKVPRIKV